jgi:hypothetical protein
MKLTFDSPFTLTFALGALLIMFIAPFGSELSAFFVLDGISHFDNLVWYAVSLDTL